MSTQPSSTHDRELPSVGDQFVPRHLLPDHGRTWAVVYTVAAVLLAVLFVALRRFPDVRFGDFAILTASASALALIAGVLTLVRHFSRPNNYLLLIGAAFVGVSILDTYHALITSTYFVQLFPSAPERLAAWSWTTSRLFLSVMLLASWAAGRREEKMGPAGRIEARSILDEVALLAAVSLGFFIFVPLPPAYRPDWLVHRPQALVIAAIFLAALIGYLRTGLWRNSPFVKWLVLALVISFLSEALFVPYSAFPNDMMSAAAHVLKIAAYACVLTGAIESAFRLFRRVEEAGLELERANSELEAADRAVRDYARRLQSSNRELEQFAYAASHDLQEPLRMIGGYSRLLARKYEGQLDEQADLYIGYAVEGVDRMQKLIDDLLSYSRVETHGKPFESVSADQALDWALANLEAALEESGAQVVRGSLPEVTAEPTQLGQLFQNLISNAIKYGPASGAEIHVAAARAEEGWKFSVSDNGIGIDPEDLDRVFELFQRLDSGASEPGTGVGLAVCKRIVDRHGGRIWVESEPEEGSTFFFTLPDNVQNTA